MGFHEVQLPPGISYGSRVGPGWENSIIELDSGADETVQRRSSPRQRYDIGYAIKRYTDLALIRDFYYARTGSANGFRFKDWSDYCTTVDGTRTSTTVGHQDVVIGTGTGSLTTFQLIKKYTNGAQTFNRTIRKPCVPYTDTSHTYGGVRVALNTTEQTSGFSVDYATGIVTFSSAPSNGVQVKAGFEFDVPVRFESEADRWLSITPSAFDSGNIESIQLVEVLSPQGDPEDFFYGGGTDWGTITEHQTLSVGFGRSQNYSPSVSGRNITLPDATNLSLGGPYFYLRNGGSFTYDLKTSAGATVITVPTSGSVYVILGSVAGVKTWFAK